MALSPLGKVGAAHTIKSNGITTNGMPSTVDVHDKNAVLSYWARYEHVKLQDMMKNVLLEDVISRYDRLVQQYQNFVKEREHEHERQYPNTVSQREERLEASVTQLQRILNRDPFVAVLIDGDAMTFDEKLLRDGAAGGQQAAIVLHNAIAEWATAHVVECPADVRVVVRVYANIQDIANAHAKAGLVASAAQFEDFAKGFTRGKALFDFVDVGQGKDGIGMKVAESFKLYLYDYHCRQILLGCSQDQQYTRLLDRYASDEEAHARVTLVQESSLKTEAAFLPFRTTNFFKLFRKSTIGTGQADSILDFRPRVDSRGLNTNTAVFTPRSTTPFSPPYSPAGIAPQLNGLSLADHPDSLRKTSITPSSATSCDHAGGPASTWAKITKVKAADPLVERTAPAPSISAREPVIRRNRKGQRLDDTLVYDRDEVLRLKRLKMCNQFYIGNGCCHFQAGKADKCPHRHDIKLSAQEKSWLRVVARETPCKRGSGCDDIKCIYGHKCPFPEAREGTLRGIGCLNGDNCRFPREMHGMDLVPVKTVKIT